MLATTSPVIVDLHSFWLNSKLRMSNSQISPYLCSVILSDDDGSNSNVKKQMLAKQQLRTHARASRFLHFLDVTARLPRETSSWDVFTSRRISFFFLTWQYGPSEFYSGKNHPRLTNWAGLNAIKFKKRELFFLPTFSLPLSSRLLKLAIFRGGKLTNPLLRLFFLSHLFPY